MEWLELDGTHTQGYTYGVSVSYPANYPRLNHLIVHDMSYSGIAIADYVSGARIENSLVYNTHQLAGDQQTGAIETMGPASMDTVHIFNTTIYGTVTRSGIGCYHPQEWVIDVRNVISMGNYGSDFASGVIYSPSCVTNLSSDNSAPGTGSLLNKTADVQFVSLTGKNFHLATASDAVNVGSNLSAYFTDDIDGETRSEMWDMGADEYVDLTPPENAMDLTANWVDGNSVKVTWTPSAVTASDADSVGLWYKTTDYPDSANDESATYVGKYYLSDSVQTIELPVNKTYYIVACVRDNSGNWSDTATSAADTAYVPLPISKYSKSFKPNASVDYLIITSGEKLNMEQYQRLALLKKARGLKTLIMSVDEIAASQPGVDLQEKIRNYIKFAYNEYKISWVLLGGDYKTIPPRYVYSRMEGGMEIMTDMYYACLDGDYNKVKDNHIGTVQDLPDIIPEVVIGRIPSMDWNEARIMIDKIMKYTFKGMKNNRKVLFSGMYELDQFYDKNGTSIDDGTYYGHEVLKPILDSSDILVQLSEIYEDEILSDGTIKDTTKAIGADSLLSRLLDYSPMNLWVHYGHGGEEGIATTNYYTENQNIGIYRKLLFRYNGRADSIMAHSTNCMVVGCGTTTPNYTSIARSFMAVPTGALTYFAASNYDYPSSSINIQKAYIQALYQDSVFSLGKAAMLARSYSIVDFDIMQFDYSKLWLYFTYSFLGDPGLELLTDSMSSADTFSIANIGSITVQSGLHHYVFDVERAGDENEDKGVLVTMFQEGGAFHRVYTNNGTAEIDFPAKQASLTGDNPVYIAVSHHRGYMNVYKKDVTVDASLPYIVVEDHEITSPDSGIGDTIGYDISFKNIGKVHTTTDISIQFSLTDSIDTNSALLVNTTATINHLDSSCSQECLLRLLVLPGAKEDKQLPITVRIQEGGRTYWDYVMVSIAKRSLMIEQVNYTKTGNVCNMTVYVKNNGTLSVPACTLSLSESDPAIFSVSPSQRTLSTLAANASTSTTFDVTVDDTLDWENAQMPLLYRYNGIQETLLVQLKKPEAVTKALALSAGQGKMQITWTMPENVTIGGYDLYRKEYGGTSFDKRNSTLLTGANFIDDVAVTSTLTKYIYKILPVSASMVYGETAVYCTTSTQLVLKEGYPIYKPSYISDARCVDLDNDGDKEFVFSDANGVVYAYHHDLSEYITKGDNDGEVFTQRFGYLAETPALGDLDNDGSAEIIFCRGDIISVYFPVDNSIILLKGFVDSADLAVKTEYSDEPTLGEPVIADMDGDGSDEIIVSVDNLGQDQYQRTYLVKWNGSALVKVGSRRTFHSQCRMTGASAGNIITSEGNEFIYPVSKQSGGRSGRDSLLYVFNYSSFSNSSLSGDSAQPVDSFNLGYGHFIPKRIILADLNGDGYTDPIFCDVDSTGDLYGGGQLSLKAVSMGTNPKAVIFNEPIGEWSFSLFYLSPVAADIDNDGKREIMVLNKNAVYIFKLNTSGAVIARDTLQVNDAYNGYFTTCEGLFSADVDGDGNNDILVTVSLNEHESYLLAFNASTHQKVDGFPIYLGQARTWALSALIGTADVDNDNKLEIYSCGLDGNLSVFESNSTNINSKSFDCQGMNWRNTKNAESAMRTPTKGVARSGRVLVYDDFIREVESGTTYYRYIRGMVPDYFAGEVNRDELNLFPNYAVRARSVTGDNKLHCDGDFESPLFVPFGLSMIDGALWSGYKIGGIGSCIERLRPGFPNEIADNFSDAGVLFYSHLPDTTSYYLLHVGADNCWTIEGQRNGVAIPLDSVSNTNYNATSLINYRIEVRNQVTKNNIKFYVDNALQIEMNDTCVNRVQNGSVGFYADTGVTGSMRKFNNLVVQKIIDSYTPTFASGTHSYTIGTASVAVTVSSVSSNGTGWTIQFSGNPDLSRIFENDCFTDGSQGKHKWKITSVNDVTNQITVVNSEYSSSESPEPSSATDYPATVGRWFNTLQAWESAREGNLVSDNRIEKGICYNDEMFTENLRIAGSISDASHYMWLTVANGERHNGTAGTGVTLDPAGTGHAITVLDSFAIVEGLEVKGWGAPGMCNQGITVAGAHTQIRYCLVHDEVGYNYGSGISFTGNDVKIYRNIVYETSGTSMTHGISDGNGWLTGVAIKDNTVYNIHGTGIHKISGSSSDSIFNNIVVDCGEGDFDVPQYGPSGYNFSSDASAIGQNCLTNKTAANQFTTLTGTPNLHLKVGADAIDTGWNMGSTYGIDIDGSSVGSTWDMGADER
ncbi:MAG: hypothetical protein A2293_13390 [Elusimicrobia bacterium RIFOXYB2_FULL_49_7]|nr:MAG: hypothetical protein A2293_13390 [Elusimicrobia bacterium RIFOXYB2_FULL_49_7]